MYRLQGLIALTGALLVGGCFELGADAKFGEDGKATVEVELAVSLQFAALLGVSKDGSGDFSKDCGKTVGQRPAGTRVIRQIRGTRGDMMTCTVIAEIADPVEASKQFVRDKPMDGGFSISEFRIERLSERSYRVFALFESLSEVAKRNEPDPFEATLIASMANRYLTFKVSGVRIANTTGELSNDGRTATWKIPVALVIKPPPGYRQEVKADVVFAETWWDKVKSFVGLQ